MQRNTSLTIRIIDQNYQYIYWKEKPTEELFTYKLTTATYETSGTPFIATRYLQQQHASESISNDVHIVDVLTGANSIAEAMQVKDDITEIFKSAHMHLGKT